MSAFPRLQPKSGQSTNHQLATSANGEADTRKRPGG